MDMVEDHLHYNRMRMEYRKQPLDTQVSPLWMIIRC